MKSIRSLLQSYSNPVNAVISIRIAISMNGIDQYFEIDPHSYGQESSVPKQFNVKSKKNGARTTGSPQVIRKWSSTLIPQTLFKKISLRQIADPDIKSKTSKFIGENWENIFVTLEKADISLTQDTIFIEFKSWKVKPLKFKTSAMIRYHPGKSQTYEETLIKSVSQRAYIQNS